MKRNTCPRKRGRRSPSRIRRRRINHNHFHETVVIMSYLCLTAFVVLGTTINADRWLLIFPMFGCGAMGIYLHLVTIFRGKHERS